MIEFLLDTNIVSGAVKPQPNPLVLQRLQASVGKLSIAAVTWHELLYGMRRLPPSKRREDLDRYLSAVVASTMSIIPYEERAADWFATERAPSYPDGQIAAIAAVNDVVIVTRNISDFADFNGVRLAN